MITVASYTQRILIHELKLQVEFDKEFLFDQKSLLNFFITTCS